MADPITPKEEEVAKIMEQPANMGEGEGGYSGGAVEPTWLQDDEQPKKEMSVEEWQAKNTAAAKTRGMEQAYGKNPAGGEKSPQQVADEARKAKDNAYNRYNTGAAVTREGGYFGPGSGSKK